MNQSFESEREIALLISRGRADVKFAESVLDSFQKAPENTLEHLAGASLVAMRLCRDTAEKYLLDDDANLRVAALLLIDNYWFQSENSLRLLEKIAIESDDPRMRGLALNSLRRQDARIQSKNLKEVVKSIFPRDPRLGEVAASIRQLCQEESEGWIAESNRQFALASQRRLEVLAGGELNAMLVSREMTQSYLSHPDSKLRCAAIILMSMHWKGGEELVANWEFVVANDSSDDVKQEMICALADYYGGSNDCRVGKLLATLVRNTLQSLIVREAAYQALFQLRGIPAGNWPVVKKLECGFHFPDQVIWEFVDSFFDCP